MNHTTEFCGIPLRKLFRFGYIFAWCALYFAIFGNAGFYECGGMSIVFFLAAASMFTFFPINFAGITQITFGFFSMTILYFAEFHFSIFDVKSDIFCILITGFGAILYSYIKEKSYQERFIQQLISKYSEKRLKNVSSSKEALEKIYLGENNRCGVVIKEMARLKDFLPGDVVVSIEGDPIFSMHEFDEKVKTLKYKMQFNCCYWIRCWRNCLFAPTNEENREMMEKNVPYSKQLLNTILGPSTAQSYEVKSTVSKKKPQQVAESVENLKTVVPLPVSKPEKETAVKPDLLSIQKSKKGATPIVSVDVHKPVIEKSAPTQRQLWLRMKLREEQNIARAIEEQREADQRIAEEMLNIEARRLKEQNYVDVEKRVFEQREKWETKLEDRLRRAQAAHSDHLEQVLRTQKQLYDIEHAQAIESYQERFIQQLISNYSQKRLKKVSSSKEALQMIAPGENNRFDVAVKGLSLPDEHVEPGDVAVSIGGEPIFSMDQFLEKVDNLKSKLHVEVVKIVRGIILFY